MAQPLSANILEEDEQKSKAQPPSGKAPKEAEHGPKALPSFDPGRAERKEAAPGLEVFQGCVGSFR